MFFELELAVPMTCSQVFDSFNEKNGDATQNWVGMGAAVLIDVIVSTQNFKKKDSAFQIVNK
jgi:hypothetical protein